MAILITDSETERYAEEIAAKHGRLSKAAAMRLIADEHRRLSAAAGESPAASTQKGGNRSRRRQKVA